MDGRVPAGGPVGAGDLDTSRGGPPRLSPLRFGDPSSRNSRRGSAGGGTGSGLGREAIRGGGTASGIGPGAAWGGGGDGAGTSGVWPWGSTGETPEPSGRPIRSPRVSRSLDPLLAGGTGATLGTGRGSGREPRSGPLGAGRTSAGGSKILTRSGLSSDTGGLATSSSRPKSPAWTSRETTSDLLSTDCRIILRRLLLLGPCPSRSHIIIRKEVVSDKRRGPRRTAIG
jgi:hypothetical protein